MYQLINDFWKEHVVVNTLYLLITTSFLIAPLKTRYAQEALKAPIVFIKATGDWEETGTEFPVSQDQKTITLKVNTHH